MPNCYNYFRRLIDFLTKATLSLFFTVSYLSCGHMIGDFNTRPHAKLQNEIPVQQFRPSLCLSVCLSHFGTVSRYSKRLNNYT